MGRGPAPYRRQEPADTRDVSAQALELYRELGDAYHEADTLIHLADTHNASGDLTAAQRTRQHALRILEELDHPEAEKVRAHLTANQEARV